MMFRALKMKIEIQSKSCQAHKNTVILIYLHLYTMQHINVLH